ncbi:bifunctional 4-hydroxy-2-oxoglutarate aldolase/2-dehydro-3-deoxy-phosphogluconate aldolase [Lysinimonas soli]|uniref:2-dehydro-3-deoxy-phosphogluconate aldolase n=1 Tax=Lysinimonas soli TaxID=1074233 RepID=A0ABW0NTU6_9MICO
MTAELSDSLAGIGVLPVIVIDDPRAARPLAEALRAGGVGCAEVTLRTPAGRDSIAEMSAVEGFLVGAGTVLTVEQLDASAAAGARFAVSPGFDGQLVDRAMSSGVLAIPGIATASETMAAMRAGVRTVKLFPAAQLGGPAMIAALRGPFPEMSFVPSGGIDIDNVADYGIDGVLCVSTSWIAPRAMIAQRDFATIAERARAFVSRRRS